MTKGVKAYFKTSKSLRREKSMVKIRVRGQGVDIPTRGARGHEKSLVANCSKCTKVHVVRARMVL